MSKNIQWEARKFADKALKKAVQDEIAKLALVVLGNNQLKIEYSEEGFDPYTYCKHTAKKYCPIGSSKMRYRGKFREYYVYGATRTDVYLEVLKRLANDSSTYYPIVAPRLDDEYIEKKKYDELVEFKRATERTVDSITLDNILSNKI